MFRASSNHRLAIAALIVLTLVIGVVPVPAVAEAPVEPDSIGSQAQTVVYLPLALRNWLPEPEPSSETLIEQAVAAGTLDTETALIYKVYAVFGDSRLPSQYHGDDSQILDSETLTEVMAQWSSLSSQAQAILAPFLLPPTEAGSYEQLQAGTASGLSQAQAIEWRTVDAASGVRVWYQPRFPGDAAKAAGIATAIDGRIYPSLMTVMNNRTWLPDGGYGNVNGGDDRLDIYLVSRLMAPGVTVSNSGCDHTPVFIFIKNNLGIGDDMSFGLVHVVAHEMMHAVQQSYDGKDSCASYRWLKEATAHWFMDYVYPNVNFEHRSARRFLSSSSLSLEDRSNERDYGAYLLPFYLTHTTGSAGFVSSFWVNSESFSSLDAVDIAIPGGFAAVWPEFVRYNWNKPPQDDYRRWDNLLYSPFFAPITVALGRNPLPVELKHLSAWYYDLTFSDDNIRSVIFYNGLAFNLTEGPAPGFPGSQKYVGQALSAEEMAGVGIHALIKVAGQDWMWEDWSYSFSEGFCRDAKAERLEELVIIFSNREFDQNSPNYVLKPRGLAPMLLTSDIGCWQWKGTVTRTQMYLEGVTETYTTAITFERTEAGIPSEDQIYQVKEGSLQWSIAGTFPYDPFSTWSGSKTVTLLPTDGTLITYNSHTGGAYHRGYFAGGTCTETLPATISYADGTSTSDEIPGCIWLVANETPQDPRTLTSSTVAIGTYSDTISTNQWHLEAQREP